MKNGGTEIEEDVGDRDMTGEGGDYVGRGAKKDMKRRWERQGKWFDVVGERNGCGDDTWGAIDMYDDIEEGGDIINHSRPIIPDDYLSFNVLSDRSTR